MIGSIKDLTRNMDGSYNLTITVKDDCRPLVDQLKDTAIDVEIKKHRNKRSLDANAFCWALCSDIGKALKPPVPKEEIYRNAIRGLGKHDLLLARADTVEAFSSSWSKNGTGWFVEIAGQSKLEPEYVWIYAYSGTSSYDSKEMAILIDGLVDDAEQMGLQIPLGKKDIERLKGSWRGQHLAG